MSMDIDADSPVAEGSTRTATPERQRSRPAWLRRDVFGVDAVVVLLLVIPLVIGLAAHMRWGLLYPPDSRYYVTMALRDMGKSPAEAMTQQLKVTGQPAESWYFSSADPVWRMVQPRMLYPLLSVPFVWMFGVSVGMAVVPALAMLITVLAVARLVQRRYGPFTALAAAGALTATGIAVWLPMALTDAPAVALVALILLRLPLGRRTSGRDLIWLGAYAAGLCMTRQVTPMIAGLVCGGWLWAFLFPAPGLPRRFRNEWLAPAAVVTGVSLVGQAAFSKAYPYNVTQQFLYASDQPTLHKALMNLPSLSWSLARSEVVYMLHNDHYLLVLMTAPLVYALIRFKDEMVGMFLGGAAGTAVLVLANGIPSGMRYESVLAPAAVLVFGALTERLGPVALRGGPVAEISPALIPRPAPPAPASAAPRAQSRREMLRIGTLAATCLAVLAGAVAWSATHGSGSVVALVPTSPASAAALADTTAAVVPADREPAEHILEDCFSQASIMSQGGLNWLYMIADWRHPLRYRPMGPSDPGWLHRAPDGTATIRFGDFTLPQQIRFGAALSLQNTVKPETLKVLWRRTSGFGEDVVFRVADQHGHEQTGRATVLYPLRPSVTGLVTRLVFDSPGGTAR